MADRITFQVNDEIINYVSNSKLGEWDKEYVLGELTGWEKSWFIQQIM